METESGPLSQIHFSAGLTELLPKQAPEKSKKTDAPNFSKGTAIKISQLNDVWDVRDSEKLKETLEALTMSPTEYEKAVLEFFRIYFPAPKFDVRHNVQMLGAKSRIPRQVDIAIYSQGSQLPPLVVEAKRYARPIDAEKAGGTIALIRDVATLPPKSNPAVRS